MASFLIFIYVSPVVPRESDIRFRMDNYRSQFCAKRSELPYYGIPLHAVVSSPASKGRGLLLIFQNIFRPAFQGFADRKAKSEAAPSRKETLISAEKENSNLCNFFFANGIPN